MPEVNRSQAIRDHFKLNPKATTQEVVDALAKQGVVVSPTLVRTVKAKHNQRQAARKAAKAEAKGVDKQPEVSKSDAIRDYYRAHPKAKTSEVVEALAREGIKVSVSLVTTVKSKHNKRRRAAKTLAVSTGVDMAQIKAAFGLLKACGSLSAAKAALNAAEEIKKMV